MEKESAGAFVLVGWDRWTGSLYNRAVGDLQKVDAVRK